MRRRLLLCAALVTIGGATVARSSTTTSHMDISVSTDGHSYDITSGTQHADSLHVGIALARTHLMADTGFGTESGGAAKPRTAAIRLSRGVHYLDHQSVLIGPGLSGLRIEGHQAAPTKSPTTESPPEVPQSWISGGRGVPQECWEPEADGVTFRCCSR